MDNFQEIKHNFLRTKNNFIDSVKDKFGRSINNEYLEAMLNNLDIMVNQESKIDSKMQEIKRLLNEAKSIQPDMGA